MKLKLFIVLGAIVLGIMAYITVNVTRIYNIYHEIQLSVKFDKNHLLSNGFVVVDLDEMVGYSKTYDFKFGSALVLIGSFSKRDMVMMKAFDVRVFSWKIFTLEESN